MVKIPRHALALDTSLAGARTTGIGLYTIRLARELARLRGDRLWLVGGAGDALPRDVAHSAPRLRSRTASMLAEVPWLLARHAPALFHGLRNFALPLTRPRGTRFVLTVHDVIPLSHPGAVSAPYRAQFALWLRNSLRLCDAVLCDTEATRRALLERFPGVAATVVHLGADHVPPREQMGPSPIERPYVLYVGALDARKNVGTLLDAFARLAGAREAALVIAGQAAFGSAGLEARIRGLRERGLDVRLLGHQPEGRLWELMAGAAALACPSAIEGFGLPPLEGLSLGVPVIASDIGAHREVLGDAVLYAPPGDADALADGLRSILEDSAIAARLRAQGPRRAAAFTWRRCAEETARTYAAVTG